MTQGSFIVGSGGGGCFTGATLILTPSGEKEIQQIAIGDLVISFDDIGGIFESKVLQVHVHDNEDVFEYNIWGGKKLEATPNHWVLNQFNAFACIGTFMADDCLVDQNAHLRPIISKKSIGKHTVYNLTVDTYHTFIANGIRVHNSGLGDGLIAGAGGRRRKQSYQPVTDADSLNSSAYVQLVDLISEGEIEGFPDASQYARDSSEYRIAMLKNIYIDKTPVLTKSANISSIQSSDYNFNGVNQNNFDIRWGTQNQGVLSGYEKSQNERSVGIVVKQNEPVTRTITDTDIDRVRVTLTWAALQKITDKGDILGTSVRYQIAVSYNGSAYSVLVDSTVSGRTGDQYQKSDTITLSGEFPVSIRVIRITENSSDTTKFQNEFSWTSYTEITDAKLIYPNSALVAMQVDAKNFSSVPARSYRIRGIKVSIPSNATVDSTNGRLTYSGTWDGTFAAQQWCADPCWCLWDLLTNCRYGLGQHIHTKNLDKWSFYQASVYCNELVKTGLKDSSGQDEYEPRFLCNVSIQTQDEAYKLINDMCSVFRAMPYWSVGSLSIAQDRPLSPTYLFNQTNIGEEGFQYSGSSLKSRHTVATVGYLDLENQELAYESVEDQTGIAKYGIVTAEVTAFACTSKSQARRVGEWLLYTEQYETETVTFTTTIDGGIAIRPGMVIATSDPSRAGARRGGRIRAGGTNYIVVDEPLATDLATGQSPTVSAMMTDGTVESRTVSSVSGAKVTVSTNFTSTPLVGGSFIYNDNTINMQQWRVLAIEEEDGIKYKITALAYNSSKYDYVERGASIETTQASQLTLEKASDPQNVSGQVTSSESNGQLSNNLLLSWKSDPNAVEYEVRYRIVG
jgi:predicted phage tail protein